MEGKHFTYTEMRQLTALLDDEKTIEEGKNKHEAVVYSTMLDNLELLDKWCKENGREAFSTFMQDAVIGAYFRYRRAKRKTWNEKPKDEVGKKHGKKTYPALWVILTAVITGLPAMVLPFIDGMFNLEDINPAFIQAAFVGYMTIAILATVVGVVAKLFEQKLQLEQEEEERAIAKETLLEVKHNYYETWTRHSLCYSRLCLALDEFAVSEGKMEDFQALEKRTFRILQQNLDQFAVNVSPHGLAGRAQVDD